MFVEDLEQLPAFVVMGDVLTDLEAGEYLIRSCEDPREEPVLDPVSVARLVLEDVFDEAGM